MTFLRKCLIAFLALSLTACASAQKLDAANDVHALLTSIRDGDQATFETHIDRRALEREIEARLRVEARRQSSDLGVLGAMLAPALAQLAGDALIQPQVFRAVAESYGYQRSKPLPGQFAIASVLRRLEDGRVCATRKKDGPCVLIFTQVEGVWKLSGFEGDLSQLKLKR